jgi:hypothetical protein
MHGSRSKIPSKKSRPYIYDVKFLAVLGAPYIHDISKLRFKCGANPIYYSADDIGCLEGRTADGTLS